MKITFLIGNGFDISLAERYDIKSTSYSSFYDWNQFFEFNEVEQKLNNIVNNIYSKNKIKIWSDFECGLIESFNKVNNYEDVVSFFKDKDQICNYLTDFLERFQERMDKTNYLDEIWDEFTYSILKFMDRLDNQDKNIVKEKIDSCIKEGEHIVFDFINFNGTNTLENLINKLKNNDKNLKFDNYNNPIKIGSINYIHSKLKGKTANYHVYGLGTTESHEIFNKYFFDKLCPSDSFSIPDSINNILNKTNYDFKDWIKETDVVVTHGLSFGATDSYYWNIIKEKLKEGGLFIDFPYVRSKVKNNNSDILTLKKERKSRICSDMNSDNIIISINKKFKSDLDTSDIFSF